LINKILKNLNKINIIEINAMERKKLVAVITGIISVLLGIIYLLLVQLLDSRGAMIPAPITDLSLILSPLI
jgi:hypothetical protein